jgi:methylase of polypeptide subunit release factors
MSASATDSSTTSQTLRAALERAVRDGSVDEWLEALKDPLVDPLAAISESTELQDTLFGAAGYADMIEWLNHIEEWSEQQYKDPRADDDPLVRVLYETWQYLKESLGRLLAVASDAAGFPERGGVLCFTAGLELCLVIEFQFHRAAPSLTLLAVVSEPKAAFAIWSSIEDQPPARRDALRKMLVSGHKLVFHRGVLVHVDRREDTTVFGPSIDTLVMAELLARDVYRGDDSARLPRSFLEVGTGSGMLLAGALTALPDTERLVGVELNFGSAICTHRNLLIANGGLDPLEHDSCVLVAGEFQAGRFEGGFDLVACNPPYLPNLASPAAARGGGEDYLRAVGGRELIDQLLGSLDELLSPRGRLLLMTNNMAVDLVEESIPDGFIAERPFGDAGRSVLLELEALYERQALLKQMLDDGDIRQNGDVFEHTLHPLWIGRESV